MNFVSDETRSQRRHYPYWCEGTLSTKPRRLSTPALTGLVYSHVALEPKVERSMLANAGYLKRGVACASRLGMVFSVVLLAGCGAIWDQMYPPEDPREALAFHLASPQPNADWQLRAGPLGDPQVYVQPTPLFTAAAIEMAAPMIDARKQYFVGVKLDATAAQRLAQATQRQVPMPSVMLQSLQADRPASRVLASGTQPGWLALLEHSKLISVMPIDQPITGGTFAIPVRDAAAAQALSKAFGSMPQ